MVYAAVILNRQNVLASAVTNENDFVSNILPLCLLLFALVFLLPGIVFLLSPTKRMRLFKVRSASRDGNKEQRPWFRAISFSVVSFMLIWLLFTSVVSSLGLSRSPVPNPTPKTSPSPIKRTPEPSKKTPTVGACQTPGTNKTPITLPCTIPTLSATPSIPIP